jgi:pyruvate dehydrogenase E2 component (dihydrolipoamide acetyltransferase)
MATEIQMPELGSDMTEADLVQWLVGVGDTISAGDLLAEIETDKATVEYESPVSGVIVELCVSAPATGVKVGELIARIEESGADAEPKPQEAEPQQPKAASHAEAGSDTSSNAGSQGESDAVSDAGSEPDSAPEAPSSGEERVPATALARRIAEIEGVDLRDVEPSGAGGRVTKADVRAASEATSERAQAPAAAAASEEAPLSPLSRMRRIIARRMSEAKREIPHFYLEIRCDARQLLAMRAKLNEGRDGPGLSVNDFCVAAAARALRDVPQANVAWRDEAIERFSKSDVAVAVAIDDGLITPVLRDAAGLGLVEISTRLRALIERARAGRLAPEEYQGGFALSNLGMYGVTAVWPIVNPPHACILGIGAVEEVPVVDDGAIVVGARMTCTLSADHRAVDGAIGARLLAAFRRYVEDPLEMIL